MYIYKYIIIFNISHYIVIIYTTFDITTNIDVFTIGRVKHSDGSTSVEISTLYVKYNYKYIIIIFYFNNCT